MWNEFLSLIYPKSCPGCGEILMKNEKSICTTCLTELLKTDYYKYHANPVSMIFWGRIQIETATSIYCFSKESKIQKLIYALKYGNKTQIGEILGVELGKQILKSDGFKKVDIIIPVPLHKKKEKERGYNQSYFIAKGVSKVLNVPVNKEVLIRKSFNATQTGKTRFDRWMNVNHVFSTTNQAHLLNKKTCINSRRCNYYRGHY